MKRLGLRWAAGLVGAGAAMGVAWGLAVDASQDVRPAVTLHSVETVLERCDDACVRSRGAAALVVLSQRPPQ
ncbi:hypothetical protein [Cupriavidus taiwanensis]|uniref:Uncharacterized protein n=1 Tax=Cupriavidus taiwanensis TaxID=164546 RepID=A0A7Z7JF28_9BURK|nr:hypothetical protein [Cupriavidus taiwanensis]SOZ09743.1 conserved hypothetical protein; putative exported protein [Cupriavidus taiwanensis]SOZ11862.1 conserved hypothetical protein; putative exported protein [Cupriavidus taiwanensis]SOZ43217.1 conserved hypothetical protein; putative exported protein [Cupriavidus taiwanensis]SPC22463.1 conserved hypothetical protein; putative exported protein [Cupriavidus taiwanensis]SPD53971.1 conserved protein of unknown function [Cupriavidus taiwanensis